MTLPAIHNLPTFSQRQAELGFRPVALAVHIKMRQHRLIGIRVRFCFFHILLSIP